MATNNACTVPAFKWSLQGIFIRYFAVFIFVFLFFPEQISAQDEPEYDEITVFFSVPRIGGADLPAVVRDEVLYLSVTDVFSFLKIKTTYTSGFDSISGFFINQQASYLIDRRKNRIEYQQKVFDLKPGDIVRTETNLYLKSSYFGEIFGLECSFNFRSLMVTLNTKIELPIIREMRLEQMRKNVGQIKGDIVTDTTFKRSFPFFHFGMADWTATSTQQLQGSTDTRLSLTLGSVIAGGEANVTLNYSSSTPFNKRDQYYLWRYANNDHKALRQVSLGKIAVDATSSLNSPIIGVQFTNNPTTYRRSYGSYTLSDVTEPGWLVELYVNNVLVDYKKADASGFFTFEVPLVYGNTSVKLQFYGPWGEERSKEKNISIPFNFLPVGEFEYRVSAGMVEDSLSSRFSRANFDFGVTRFLTIGGGVEYLSSLASGKVLPFLNASLRLAPSLLLSGEYTYGVSAKGIVNYRLPSDVQFEINYTKYNKDQKVINTNYLEERKISVTVPIRTTKFTVFSRLSLNQFIMPQSKYTSSELLLSGAVFGVNTNLTTNAIFSSLAKPDIYSTLALSIRLPLAFILTPQSQFNYSQGKFISFRSGLEKRLFSRGFLNLAYEHNFITKLSSMEIGFRYDFSFAKLGLSARRSNKVTTFVETASGSIIVDAKNSYVGTSNRANVGKGGILMFSFLDLNGNGHREKNEPKAKGLQVHINGGRIEYNEKDTTVRVYDLEPYASYLVSLVGTSFDNISWQLPYKNVSVVIDPNQYKRIEVPVAVVGEAAGMVYLNGSYGQRGQGRIIVNFYRSDSTLVKSTMSEEDGYFSYLGLLPGNYMAGIDTAQMRKLNMKSSPAFINFTIEHTIDGDLAEGLDFVLQKEKQDEVPEEKQIVTAEQKNEPMKEKDIPEPEVKMYSVQLFALHKKLITQTHFSSLRTVFPNITISETLDKDGLFKYSTGSFKSRSEAVKLLRAIRKIGWHDAFIVSETGREPVSTVANTNMAIPDTTLYKVQLLASAKQTNISSYFSKLIAVVPGLTITETKGTDGLYRYCSESFTDLIKAVRLQNIVRKNGWTDCFVVIYKSNNP
ncbi:MAG: SPOR domain-containing protein [Bacteroidales bacterium]|nr:SPOR domain-containing protein [Bacteroidales bacterium]